MEISQATMALIDELTTCIDETKLDRYIMDGQSHLKNADFHLAKCKAFDGRINEIAVVRPLILLLTIIGVQRLTICT